MQELYPECKKVDESETDNQINPKIFKRYITLKIHLGATQKIVRRQLASKTEFVPFRTQHNTTLQLKGEYSRDQETSTATVPRIIVERTSAMLKTLVSKERFGFPVRTSQSINQGTQKVHALLNQSSIEEPAPFVERLLLWSIRRPTSRKMVELK